MQHPSEILLVILEKLPFLPIIPLIILFSALIVLVILRRNKVTKSFAYENLRRRAILTPNELEFYHRLRNALPQFQVFPQVSFGALLETSSDISASEKTSLSNMFCKKRADFLICKPNTLEVVAVIELDDKTHRDPKKDQKRDELLHAANFRIERFQSNDKPTEKQLAALFK